MNEGKYRIVKKKFPLMANGEMNNGKVTYHKHFVIAGYKTVYFVHSKIDDALLFESTVKSQVETFCKQSITL